MPKQIFVNLPVENLERSKSFFTELGFSFNPKFTDENAACMIVSDDIFAMLLTREYFAQFTPKEIVDAKGATEVLLALSYDSRAEVEAQIEKALAAGGTRYAEPKDHGFMYQDGFQDLDGHIWEIFYYDESVMPQG